MGCGASVAKEGQYACQEDWGDTTPADQETETPPIDEGSWLCEDSPGEWRKFNPGLARQFTQAKKLGEKRLVFTLPGAGVHEVDLEALVQTHWETGTERRNSARSGWSSRCRVL